MSNITYFDDPKEFKKPDTFFVEIPKGVSSKAELLKIYAGMLKFPDYFGHNWDALEDLLKRLDWIDRDNVVVYHTDLPLLKNDDMQKYLSVLNATAFGVQLWDKAEAVKKLGFKPKNSVRFVFPTNLKKKIEYLIPTKEEWENYLLTRTLPKKL